MRAHVRAIALLGVVTALLASRLLDKLREVWELTQAATRADMAVLTAESRALRQGSKRTKASHPIPTPVVEHGASHDSSH